MRNKCSVRINEVVPDLEVETDTGRFSLHQWIGESWEILFPHPKDFTPVCTNEFSALAKCGDAKKARNTKALGVLVDSIDDHKKWRQDIELYGNLKPSFPIIGDVNLVVSKAFDMLPADAYLPDGQTPNDTAIRSVSPSGQTSNWSCRWHIPWRLAEILLRSSEHLMRFNCRLAKAPQRRQISRPVRMWLSRLPSTMRKPKAGLAVLKNDCHICER